MKKEIENAVEYKIHGKKRTRCPKCGRLGVLRKYEGEYPAASYFHKIAVIVGIPTITEGCSFATRKELEK